MMRNNVIVLMVSLLIVIGFGSGCGRVTSSLNLESNSESNKASSAADSIIIYKTSSSLGLSVSGTTQGSFHVETRAGDCAAYRHQPDIICEPNYPITLATAEYGSRATFEDINLYYNDALNGDLLQVASHVGAEDDIVIAVLDSGLNLDRYPELKKNLWQNKMEIPNNGIDDDGNGYIDDIHGWNFTAQNADIKGQNADHGTDVATVLLAVTAQHPNIKIMVLKIFDGSTGHMSHAINAMNYAINNGAKLSNHSYTSVDESEAFKTIAADRPDHLIIAASGNEAKSIDSNPRYPASYELDNVISVGAIQKATGLRAMYSNYGNTVDVFTIGELVINNTPKWGTSYAAPVISAMLALGQYNSDLSAMQIKEKLVQSADINTKHDRVANISRFIESTRKTSVCGLELIVGR